MNPLSPHPVSRRGFLGTAAAAMMTPLALPAFTSRLACAIIQPKPPYWIGGCPGTSSAPDETSLRAFYQFAQRSHLPLDTIETREDLTAYLVKLTLHQPDALFLLIPPMGAWHWANDILQTRIPTSIYVPSTPIPSGHILELSPRPHLTLFHGNSGTDYECRPFKNHANLCFSLALGNYQ